jgi:DNA polymerase-1
LKEIYLIDGSAFIYRAFHAVAPLTNASGFQTNAVFGFVSMVNRLLRERQPSHIAVAFDTRGKVFRHQMYPDYKANRPPMPEALAAQVPYIKEVVTALGLISYEENEIEADDIIGTAARGLSSAGHQVVIVSGDKDLLQLIDDRITMWDPMNDRVMDPDGVRKKYQVGPDQLLDCFALIGDSSDNVPGVPGIGPKTAAKLIGEFGTLEKLYDNVETLKKSKMKERLIENRETAFLSRDLIRLKTDVAVPLTPDGYVRCDPDQEKLRELYTELSFTSLLKELDSGGQKVPTGAFSIVTGNEELKRLTAALADAPILVIDTETDSLLSRSAGLVGISLNCGGDDCWYIPLGHLDGDGQRLDSQLSKELVRRELSPFLTSPTLPKLAHNLKFDYAVLRHGFEATLQGPLLDTMIAAYLMEPSRRSYKLDDLCLEHGLKLTSYKEVTGG